MKLTIKDIQGASQGEWDVKFTPIDNGRATQAVHQTVVAYRAAQRSGTACTKTMGEVAGSGKKPWRQKGTGRARAGSFASPLWRGGGVVFGPKPRDYTKKVSHSTRQVALLKAISERLKADDVLLVDKIEVSGPKTKEFLKIVNSLQLDGTALFIVDKPDNNLLLAARNLPGIDFTTGLSLNTYQVLGYDKLVFTKEAFAQLEQRLTKA